MSTVTLKILFSGLIAYSPTADGKSLTAMVLNDASSHHMPHQAFLTLRSGVIGSTDLLFEPDPTEPVDPLDRASIAGGYVLTISPAPSGTLSYKPCLSLLPRDGATSKVNVCPLEAPDVLATGNKAATSTLTGTDPTLASLLALRLELSTGEFQPFDESPAAGFLNARKVEWRSPLGVTRAQYVAEVFEWVSAALAGSEVTLEFKPFDGSATKKVVLKPDGAKAIEVMISNEPTPVDYCDPSHSTSRYTVSHLGRLARLAGGPAQTALEPALSEQTDRDEIDKYCDQVNNGTGGAKKPAICYGLLMGR